MSELLHGWYVDSSPGCGAVTPQKCGNLIPSVGLIGTSTITEPDTTDVSTLPGRSTNTPSTTIPANSTKTTRAPLYVNMKDVVWFDGHSALYHLPLHANSGDFAMSFWYNPYDDEDDSLAGPGDFGVVYSGPTVATSFTDAGGNTVDNVRFFRTNPVSINTGDADAIDYQKSTATPATEARYTLGSNFVTDPIDDMQGWCHVMLSVQRAGGTSKLTMWIDKTEIVTAHDIGDVATMPFSDGTFFDSDSVRHCWTIGGRVDRLGGSGKKALITTKRNLSSRATISSLTFLSKGSNSISATVGDTVSLSLDKAGYEQIGSTSSLAGYYNNYPFGGPYTYDLSYVDGGGTHIVKANIDFNLTYYFPGDDPSAGVVQDSWVIYERKGTSKYKGSLPTDGEGLKGAITELWIAPGQFIDWSDEANRDKFHTSDLVGQHFAPVDLGDDGSTPTGTKPLIYCTGAPQQFRINRATGKKLSVFRNTTGGFVGELLDYLKPPQ